MTLMRARRKQTRRVTGSSGLGLKRRPGPAISAHAQDLLQRLALSRAFPDSGQPYRICSADEDAIHELASLQVVQPLSQRVGLDPFWGCFPN